MYLNKYKRVDSKQSVGKKAVSGAIHYERKAVPLAKACKKSRMVSMGSTESGSLYLDKSQHISVGKTLKSFRHSQMKPVWDLNGRKVY